MPASLRRPTSRSFGHLMSARKAGRRLDRFRQRDAGRQRQQRRRAIAPPCRARPGVRTTDT